MKHRKEPNFPAKQGRHLSAHRSQNPSCYTTPSLPEAIKRSDLMPSYLGYLAQKHLSGLQQDALPSISPSGTVFEPDWRSVPTQMGHICSPDQVTCWSTELPPLGHRHLPGQRTCHSPSPDKSSFCIRQLAMKKPDTV